MSVSTKRKKIKTLCSTELIEAAGKEAVEMPIELSDNALTVLKERYLRKDNSGKVLEEPRDMFRRVAQVIAGSEDLLGNGELTKKLKVSAHRFSESAHQKIEQAGGQVVVLPGKAPVVKNKQKQKSR